VMLCASAFDREMWSTTLLMDSYSNKFRNSNKQHTHHYPTDHSIN